MGCITECTAGFAKYTLFLLNLLILVAAILLIAFGVKNRSDSAGVLESVTGFTIGIGVFIALIAFFGCCGAVKESPCLLNTYATILIIFFILQVVLGALAFVAISNKDTDINKTLLNQLLPKYQDYKSNKEEVDSIQKTFQCCGLTGHPIQSGPLSSCCKEEIKPCTMDKKFDQTCDDALANVLESNIRIIGGIAIGFSIVELVAATFACYVRCTR